MKKFRYILLAALMCAAVSCDKPEPPAPATLTVSPSTLDFKADGNLRMYVASGIATSSWWTREFNAVDGKIAFRLMEELAAVPVTAGQKVTLDFNAGTAVVE